MINDPLFWFGICLMATGLFFLGLFINELWRRR